MDVSWVRIPVPSSVSSFPFLALPAHSQTQPSRLAISAHFQVYPVVSDRFDLPILISLLFLAVSFLFQECFSVGRILVKPGHVMLKGTYGTLLPSVQSRLTLRLVSGVAITRSKYSAGRVRWSLTITRYRK